MRILSILLSLIFSIAMFAEARSSKNPRVRDSRNPVVYSSEGEPCNLIDCSDKQPIDPADDGTVPPYDDNYDGDSGRDTGSDYINGMPY